MEKILFRTSGGLGKQICATAVAQQIKFKYPDSILHVQTSYPDCFIGLDFVDKVFPHQPQPYFYDEHKEFEILEYEPYIARDYRHNKEHLISVWCKKLGLDVPTNLAGTIVLDEQEINTANQMLVPQKLDRPLVAFQYVGGTSLYDPNTANDPTRIKHTRDLSFETATQIVEKMVTAGLAVIQISLPTEKRLEKCIQLPDNQVISPRFMFAVLKRCDHGVFIDSFAQHAWMALGKKNAIVVWGGTHPKNLGYESNTNIFDTNSCKNLHCNRPDTFMMDVVGNGQLWKCPYGGKCMKISPDMVVNALMSQVHKKEA